MENIELLRFAAKAAGHLVIGDRHPNSGINVLVGDRAFLWSPLHDSGDCFSLAAILHMSVSFGPMESHACTISGALRGNQFTEKHTDHNMDVGAATRLAITRAAAEAGQNL